MEQNAQRELRSANPEWSVSESMARIARALVADGPALAFGKVQSSQVPSRVSIVVATTGSSGISKEVGLSAGAILASAKASNKYLGAEFGNTWSLLLPLTHIAAINVLARALELGTEPIDLRNHQGEFPRADFTAIVPTQLFKALNGDDDLLKHLRDARAVLIGGAALSSELHLQAEAAGINLVTTYGMTETSGGCVYNGTPLPGVEIRIGETIQIKGAMLARVLLENGFFITKDLGFMKDGKLIVTGRADDVIISGGKNISLSAVENLLGFEFAAMGRANKEWGTALIIVTTSEIEEKEIQSQLSEKFGIKALDVIRVSEIPRTALQKVDRAALAKLLS